MNGCCVDRAYDEREGLPERWRRGCTEQTCMSLPDGKTCADCRGFQACVVMGFAKAENTSCDFFPRIFCPVEIAK